MLSLAAAAGCDPAREPEIPPARAARGTLVHDTLPSRALRGNPLGDPPDREVVVYLPPGYHDAPSLRYPVLYLLHGFDGSSRQFLAPPFSLPAALDSLLATGAIAPMIVVLPDGRNRLGGSFFTNTSSMGRWGDFVAEEVVDRVDARYRTLAGPASRGVAGWSMGGFGALTLAMRHPDRFGAVYAMSPCCLGPEMLEDLGPGHPAWEEVLALEDPDAAAGAGFHARLLLAASAAVSPDQGSSPLEVALPFAAGPGGARPAEPGHSRWRAASVRARVAEHRDALRRLRGIGVDAGTRDAFGHIPATVRQLSEALAAAGIPHLHEAYPGTHGSHVPERLRRVVLPFFSERLAGPEGR